MKPYKSPSDNRDMETAVIQYFLEIFRQQVKASRHSPSKYLVLEPSAVDKSRQIYELRILQHNEWKSRRMMIASLGEESGSKSRCFHVIYDDHLVVKIPAVPITDFSTYIYCIHFEQKIADRLAPRVCIAPSVSVILKRLSTACNTKTEAFSKEREIAYVDWLRSNSDYQEYLKINGAFVFFMDLSKYFILADVIASIHGHHTEAIAEEIIGNSGMMWDPNGFEGRYGEGTADVATEIQMIFGEYEAHMRNIFSAKRIPLTGIQYKFHEWFLCQLSGNSIKNNEQCISHETLIEVNHWGDFFVRKHQSAIERYRQMIRRFLLKKNFVQNKTKITGIITNIIDLLSYLKQKGVVLRDLKPDNVLVAGEPGKYPYFLSAADSFSLGLIDMETAIQMEPSSPQKLEQPLLGGTPLYATPSQIVSNEFLFLCFGDVQRILFLQDWYAAVGVIYKVVTDEYLFQETARILSVIIRTIQKASREKKITTDLFEASSRSFWQNAASEFKHNLTRQEKILKAVPVIISKNVKAFFVKSFQEEIAMLDKSIRTQIEEQSFYHSGKNHRQLLLASSQQVDRLLSDQKLLQNDIKQFEKAKECIDLLNRLKEKKQQLGQYRRLLADLEGEMFQLNAYELLYIMFNFVFREMYPEKWRHSGDFPVLSGQNDAVYLPERLE